MKPIERHDLAVKLSKEVTDCEICGQPMRLQANIPSKGKYNENHVKHRYECKLCNYTKLLYGDGYVDQVTEPIKAIEQAEKLYKDER